MKTIKVYLILLLLAGSVCMYADGLTATLQHGDEMTFYLGTSGLQAAYDAASDGDIITLSSGQFIAVSSIEKSVRIVGAYGLDATDSYGTFIYGETTIVANNVTLEGMYFQSAVTLGEISNCTIKRCYLSNNFNQSGTHTNTLVDECVIQFDYAIATGNNYSIKNSTINQFSAYNTAANVANITNCYIHYVNTSICAVYKNNILRTNSGNYSGTTPITFSAPSEFYNNYFYRTNYNSYSGVHEISFATGCVNIGNTSSQRISTSEHLYPDTTSYNIKGGDGTPIGMKGGEGFNPYPGIPRVVSATIDAQSDDKGKLNATINVKAEK